MMEFVGDNIRPLRDGKLEGLAEFVRNLCPKKIRKALVMGCGSGKEAAILAQELNTSVIGIDLKADFLPACCRIADLRQGDATCCEFADEEFDFVYCYHVIEHIPNFRRALEEMHRVLRRGGVYFIGCPNRSRIVRYFNHDVSLRQRIAGNVREWRARLRGQFRNEYGVHAGFSTGEIQEELRRVFCNASLTNITLLYYQHRHSRYKRLLHFMDWSGLGQLLFPAIYFFGSK